VYSRRIVVERHSRVDDLVQCVNDDVHVGVLE
jgi:hypothetical protein